MIQCGSGEPTPRLDLSPALMPRTEPLCPMADPVQMPEHGGEVDAAAERTASRATAGSICRPASIPSLIRCLSWRASIGTGCRTPVLIFGFARARPATIGVADPAQSGCRPPARKRSSSVLPRLLPPTRVAVVDAHLPRARDLLVRRRAPRRRGRRPEEVPEDAGVLVIANPNNPDGRL